MKRRLPLLPFDRLTKWIIVLSISAVVLGTIRMATWRSAGSPPPAEEAARPATPTPPATRPPVVEADPKAAAAAVEILTRLLAEFHIRENLIHDSGSAYSATVPKEMPLIEFLSELRRRLDDVDGRLEHIKDDRVHSRIDADLLVDDKLARRVTLWRRSGLKTVSGKAAIIIDDFGYAYNSLVKEFLLLGYPLTISIIPGLDNSQQVAREAALTNHTILVHMPMEPEEGKYADDGFTILSRHDPGTIRLRVRSAFTQLPAAVGMNNHQGSKVTADRAIMKTVLEELKRQNKIFIDSRTNSASVAVEVARSLHLPAAANQLFIDAEDNPDFIRSQLHKMADLAVSNGQVVAIGHLRKRTLRVLQEMMPRLQARGIEFVSITDVVP
ncbi:MAG TPA: divergent polysaccharide deacetylase family protein [bacterium]|nr:divergent polysaccharide deacetylase family protein [bacterium]HPN34854.1 divergent polysaccharide deacetylase family protein [bacterium]